MQKKKNMLNTVPTSDLLLFVHLPSRFVRPCLFQPPSKQSCCHVGVPPMLSQHRRRHQIVVHCSDGWWVRVVLVDGFLYNVGRGQHCEVSGAIRCERGSIGLAGRIHEGNSVLELAFSGPRITTNQSDDGHVSLTVLRSLRKRILTHLSHQSFKSTFLPHFPTPRTPFTEKSVRFHSLVNGI